MAKYLQVNSSLFPHIRDEGWAMSAELAYADVYIKQHDR